MISLSALQSGFYMLTTGGARGIHTKYLDKNRIKRCVTKMGMMIAGAWAGDQFLVVSGTGVIIGEDLSEGQSWTIGVVLLVTVGVILHSCACIAHYSHLPTGRTVTREPDVARQPGCMTPRSMQADVIDHVNDLKEETWIPHGILEISCGS